jgi:hypothetical protein
MADGYEALYARMLDLEADDKSVASRRLVEIPPRSFKSGPQAVAETGDDATEPADRALPDATEATPA